MRRAHPADVAAVSLAPRGAHRQGTRRAAARRSIAQRCSRLSHERREPGDAREVNHESGATPPDPDAERRERGDDSARLRLSPRALGRRAEPPRPGEDDADEPLAPVPGRFIPGLPLRGYVRELRLERAHALLLGGNLSSTAVAVESGFYDLPHFDKAFAGGSASLRARFWPNVDDSKSSSWAIEQGADGVGLARPWSR